jgi:cytochrome c-type biogenesis protein CcmH
MGLVSGGYSANEILAAFKSVYGERVLMAPVKSGFNILGYTMPFVVLATGAVLVGALIRRWKAPASTTVAASTHTHVGATNEERARLDAAVKNDA